MLICGLKKGADEHKKTSTDVKKLIALFSQLLDEVTDNREIVIIKRAEKEDVALIAASELSILA